MADVTKTTRKLKIQSAYDDGDTRIITVDNPRSNLTEANITALNTQATPILIGDKTGATFIGFTAAKYSDVTEVKVDIA